MAGWLACVGGGEAGVRAGRSFNVTMQSRKKASSRQLGLPGPQVRLAAGGMPNVTRTFSAPPSHRRRPLPCLSVSFFSALRPGAAALHCAAARRAGWLRREPTIWGTGKSNRMRAGVQACASLQADAPKWRSSIEQVPSLLLSLLRRQAGAQPQQGQQAPPPPPSKPWLGWAGHMERCVWLPAFVRAALLLVLRQPEKSGVWQGSVTSSNLLLIGWPLVHRSLRGPCSGQLWVGEIDAQYLLTAAGTVHRAVGRRRGACWAACLSPAPRTKTS